MYYGTGNPGPWNTEQRPGDNRWSTSVLARNPGDGTLRWAYQFTPADNWDYDSTQEMILTELTLKGVKRKVLVHFDKNGFVYTLDRATGELLSAEPYVPANWAKRIDLTTGRPEVDSTKLTGASRGTVKDICPSLEGGKNQQPAAWSPATQLFYLSTSNMCMDYTSFHASYMAGTPYLSAGAPYNAGPGRQPRRVHRVGPGEVRRAPGRSRSRTRCGAACWRPGGGVVFYGTLDGWFKAVDAKNGAVLWKFKVGSGVIGNPISFRGPDGKQYVAVYAGFGGDWVLLSGDVRSDDPADVRPPASFMPDIARHTSQGGIVWVFGLHLVPAATAAPDRCFGSRPRFQQHKRPRHRSGTTSTCRWRATSHRRARSRIPSRATRASRRRARRCSAGSTATDVMGVVRWVPWGRA